MNLQPTVARDARPYRQGMVLGLTMAEVMLLLVFCMLLAAAALLARERANTASVRSELESARTELVEATDENSKLEGHLARQNPDEDWRHLVDSAEAAGLSMAEVIEAVPKIVKLVTTLERSMAPDAMQRLTAAKMASIVEAGIAAGGDGTHDWPPIINLSEAGGYNFDSGSAVLSAQFIVVLREQVIDQLMERLEQYDVDIIEVIGHTDEQPIATRASNLDEMLPRVMADGGDIQSLVAADNAGLGLARAVSVARVLSADVRLEEYTILPLSAAQLIETGDRLTRWTSGGNVKERRRIEIRVRGRNAQVP